MASAVVHSANLPLEHLDAICILVVYLVRLLVELEISEQDPESTRSDAKQLPALGLALSSILDSLLCAGLQFPQLHFGPARDRACHQSPGEYSEAHCTLQAASVEPILRSIRLHP